MRALRFFSALPFIAFGFTNCAGAQKLETNFPTDDEIRLVLTQASRAVDLYTPFLDLEQRVLGEKGKAASQKDREVVKGIETAIAAFGKNPQAFNGSLGFAFFEWIDDASRNALACANGASNDLAQSMLSGDKGKADLDVELEQGCLNASTLLYTVSENAGALYTRFVASEEQLANFSAHIATLCTDTMKKNNAAPKQ